VTTEVFQNWTKQMYSVGRFGSHTMTGFCYGDGAGNRGWHITTWTDLGIIRHYWVTNSGEFLQMAMHYCYDFSNRHLVELLGPVEELDAQERGDVLEGIRTWEKEEIGADDVS
jgi:hypothetical protein